MIKPLNDNILIKFVEEKKNEEKSYSKIAYGVSTFLVLIAVVVGISMMNNYQKMKIKILKPSNS